MVTLADLTGGSTGTVRDVLGSSPVERANLTARGLIPGTRIVVEHVSPDGQTRVVRIGDRRHTLPLSASRQVLLDRPTSTR